MEDRYVDDNGVRRLATSDELAEINARETAIICEHTTQPSPSKEGPPRENS